LIKSVAYRASFESADVSDALFDRAVLVEARAPQRRLAARWVRPERTFEDAIIEGAGL
jgi:hypothetical protein